MKGYANNNDMAPAWIVETPYIYNTTMTVANTQYSQLLPAGCKKIKVSVQGGVSTDTYRIAYVTGKVATPTVPYLSLACDKEYTVDNLNLAATTIYFACSAISKVLQIEAWV